MVFFCFQQQTTLTGLVDVLNTVSIYIKSFNDLTRDAMLYAVLFCQ